MQEATIIPPEELQAIQAPGNGDRVGTTDHSGPANEQNPGLETQAKPHRLSEDVEMYAKRKVGSGEADDGQYTEKQATTIDDIKNRVEEFVVRGGSTELNNRVANLIARDSAYPQVLDSFTTYDQAEAGFIDLRDQILAPIEKLLKKQEAKQYNASTFVDTMLTVAYGIVEDVPQEQQMGMLKSLTTEIQKSADLITFQDLCASRLTIGDHGWMHLFQDYRDAVSIANGIKGESFTNKDIFKLGMVAAYHDTGYANPLVHDRQQEGPQNYNLDKGHPATSAAYFLTQKERLINSGIFSEEEFTATYQMVLNHENPEAAALAGSTHEDLSWAFAIADAGAAFGIDKLPPSMQRPDVVQYLSWLDFKGQVTAKRSTTDDRDEVVYLELLDREINAELDKQKNELVQRIKEDYTAEQAQAVIASLDHFGSRSMGFVLGRLSGEVQPPLVNSDGNTVIKVFGGVGGEFDNSGYFNGSKDACVKLTSKMAGELGVLGLSDAQLREVQGFLQNPNAYQNQEEALSEGLRAKLKLSVDTDGVIIMQPIDSRLIIQYNQSGRHKTGEGEYIVGVERALHDAASKKAEMQQRVAKTSSGKQTYN